MASNNYDISQLKNPVTGQERITPYHDFKKELYNASVDGSATVYSSSIDVRADSEKTIFIKTTGNFTVVPQFSDDDSGNPDWYDYCDGDGTAYSFNVNNAQKGIPISIKGIVLQLKITNNSGSAATIRIGVD